MQIGWLLWDDANVAHIRRHRVSPAEVEQVLDLDDAAVAFEDDSHRDGRLIIVLDTPTAEGDSYVVTARPMTKREERISEEARGDDQA